MYVAPNLFGKDTRSYLRRGGATILQAVATALAGNDDGIIYSLVHQADESSTARDLKTNLGAISAGGGASLGVPVERHLQDAMRRLLADGKWTVNQPGSKVWVLDDGVYVVWVGAVEDIGRLLSKDKIPGIPKDKDILADILVERGLAVAQQTPKGPRKYWRIAPMPLQRDGRKPIELTMLRLTDPNLVFDGTPPPAVERCTVSADDRPRSKDRETPGDNQPNPAKTSQIAATRPPPGADRIDPETGEVLDGPWGPLAPVTDDQQNPPPPSISPGEQDPAQLDADAWMYQTQAQWRNDGQSNNPRAAATGAPTSTNVAEEIRWEQAYLRKHGQGQGGVWLATVAEWIVNRQLTEGTDYLIEPRPTLAWPELAKRLGEEPKPLITALSAAGWLMANPDNAMRRVIEVRGLRGIQLEPTIAEHFRKAIGRGDDDVATENKPAAGTTMTGKTSPRSGATQATR